MTPPNTDTVTLEAMFSIPFPNGVLVVPWEEHQTGRKERGFQPRFSSQEVGCGLGQVTSYFYLAQFPHQ